MKNMKRQLIELLNIHGISGNEKPVREYLHPVLQNLVDTVTVDDYGNLLGEKKCGSGIGATILLSAHMDTVKGVLIDKELVENDGIIMSNKGALGADDRAGIAIILSVLRNLGKAKFDGTLKISFSCDEEIGCVGADKIDPKWYEGTDLAIIVDRRGNRDIVVGCGMAFCSDSIGFFMEDASKMIDMDWKCVEGGISDAVTFSGNGINSVNLSAGYMNEHTDREFVVIEDMRDTTRLILQSLAIVNQFCSTFEKIGHENHWVKSWKVKDEEKYGKAYYSYYKELFEDTVWAEEHDQNGDVFIYDVGNEIAIQQGDNEILLSRESLRNLVDQLTNV